MGDEVSIWEQKGKVRVGTVTLSDILTTAEATADVAHDLGTDDVDIQLEVVGSLALGAGGEEVTAIAVGVDSRLAYQGEGTKPTIVGAPATTNIRFYAKNNNAGTQDVVIKYRISSRI